MSTLNPVGKSCTDTVKATHESDEFTGPYNDTHPVSTCTGSADGSRYVGQWRGLDTRQTRRRRRPRTRALRMHRH